ncbi:hypothetical protein BDB00DRAFT_821274 [Zychaea mexicana]|uniref:uncharacterized protein n=1 Tax=Zychaea mexicana TaxID=64656 RepID=UPI0022FDC5E0|nr:uncharacterized protein BDB00DRAFT_821274 [Zychaea mexicana]KAI9493929.1 hypothetical protein BDB00DRAFT_821274 [Zychaea mexicana]
MPELSRKRKCLSSSSHSVVLKRPYNYKRLDFTKSLLSNELVLHIFSFLSASDLARCAKVSTSWSRLANDETLWKPLFLRRFRNPLLVDMKEHPKLLKRWSERAHCRNHSKKRARLEWKSMYKTNHNWRSGKCRLTCVDVGGEQEKSVTTDSVSNVRSYVQFAHDILYIAYTTVPLIEIWHIKNSRHPVMLRQLETTTTTTTTTPVSNIEQISCLKLDTSTLGLHRLVVGYVGGGLSVWEINWTDSGRCSASEVAVYTPKVTRMGRIVSIGVSYPMLLTCSSDMRLSAFCLDSSSRTRGKVTAQARLVYELQSHIQWSPISVELDKLDHTENRWRAMICFGMPVGLNTYSVGIQEVILSTDTLISSRHCAALSQEDLFFASPLSSHTLPECSQQPITAISYSEPYLITAHANNTIKQYYVRFSEKKMELIYAQTLYGHTSKVSALALDASIGRLVSGDRFGLKVWDISCSGRLNVKHDEPGNHSNDQVAFYQRRRITGTEYIVSIDGAIEKTTSKDNVSFRDMEWLQFDSDKIVAVVRDESKVNSEREKVSVRIWSFSDAS